LFSWHAPALDLLVIMYHKLCPTQRDNGGIMTPKRFFTTEGSPFTYTILDNRSGIRHGKGCYSLAPEGKKVARLPAKTFQAVKEKAEEVKSS
jgi:hypothetical protein